MGTMARSGLIKFIIPRWGPSEKVSFLERYFRRAGRAGVEA